MQTSSHSGLVALQGNCSCSPLSSRPANFKELETLVNAETQLVISIQNMLLQWMEIALAEYVQANILVTAKQKSNIQPGRMKNTNLFPNLFRRQLLRKQRSR